MVCSVFLKYCEVAKILELKMKGQRFIFLGSHGGQIFAPCLPFPQRSLEQKFSVSQHTRQLGSCSKMKGSSNYIPSEIKGPSQLVVLERPL